MNESVRNTNPETQASIYLMLKVFHGITKNIFLKNVATVLFMH